MLALNVMCLTADGGVILVITDAAAVVAGVSLWFFMCLMFVFDVFCSKHFVDLSFVLFVLHVLYPALIFKLHF